MFVASSPWLMVIASSESAGYSVEGPVCKQIGTQKVL